MNATGRKSANLVFSARTRPPWIGAVLLALLVFIVYYPVFDFGFVHYDDESYVYQNAAVADGLTWESFRWAWQSRFNGNWHPLLWLSFMLDSELYEMQPWGFHTTNFLLHLASTLLLFVTLRTMTDSTWRSFAVAALFAAHPIGVEAVAWVSERKGTLSTFFWMLAMFAYAHYARVERQRWLWATVLATACGLLCKAMLVSMPLALLLLDAWPLRRWNGKLAGTTFVPTPLASSSKAKPGEKRDQAAFTQNEIGTGRSFKELAWEKVPLFVLSAVFSVVAMQAQRASGALSGISDAPALERLVRVGVAYWIYLRKACWPSDLAANYAPPTESVSWVLGALGWLAIVAVSLLAWGFRKRLPYLAVGWFWYLVTFMPVIGITPVGVQWMADRYAVIPLLGIWIVIAWSVADVASLGQITRWLMIGVTMAAALAGVLTACRQVWYWENSIALFERVVEVEPNNALAHRSLGAAYGNERDYDRAIAQFQQSIEISPTYALALADLGKVYLLLKRPADAVPYLQRSLNAKADDPVTLYQLASAQMQLGEYESALASLKASLKLHPEQPMVEHDLGLTLARLNQLPEARAHWLAALRMQPDLAEAHGHLARSYANSGKLNEAIDHYVDAIKLASDWPQPMEELVWILAVTNEPDFHKPKEAIELARRGHASFGYTPRLLSAWAAARAAQGDFSEAEQMAADAATMAEKASLPALASTIRNLKMRYHNRLPAPAEIQFSWQ